MLGVAPLAGVSSLLCGFVEDGREVSLSPEPTGWTGGDEPLKHLRTATDYENEPQQGKGDVRPDDSIADATAATGSDRVINFAAAKQSKADREAWRAAQDEASARRREDLATQTVNIIANLSTELIMSSLVKLLRTVLGNA